MARIRTVKPEFWTDVRLSRLPTLARLVFLCLISMSDDEGRIEGDAETVRNFGFPRESVEDVTNALVSLVECSRIVPYMGPEGIPLMAIPTFRKHQRIDKPQDSKLPAPPKVTTDSKNDLIAILDPSRTDRIRYQGSGKGTDQGSGRVPEGIQGEVAPTGAPALAPSKPVRSTSPQEATARRLGTALGSTINICRKQVAALVANGWDLPRIGRAIEAHARPGMAPWEWTRRAQGENGTAKGGASVERILWMADQAEEAGK